jgi:signal transduction histidine kinase
MGASLTIFWVDVTDSDAAVLERAVREHGASLVHVGRDSLSVQTFAALAVGPVILVARTAKEASRALGMGVDEVIRHGELTDDALAATIARARAREAARSSYEMRRGLFQDDDELSLAALAAAFGRQLGQPLAAASLDCELLGSSFSALLDTGDQFVESTALTSPCDRARQLATRRLALPPSQDLVELLGHVRASLQRASTVASTLTALAAGTAANSPMPVTQLVRDIVEVMRADVAPWATIELTTAGACAASVAPITIALVVSSLLTNAVDAVRGAQRDEGRIEVRLSEHEDAIVLEVQDNGRMAPADLRPTMFEPYFGLARANRTGLMRVRERLRRCGGDLMIDGDTSGTTVRVLLPTSTDDVLFGRADEAPAALNKSTPGLG